MRHFHLSFTLINEYYSTARSVACIEIGSMHGGFPGLAIYVTILRHLVRVLLGI